MVNPVPGYRITTPYGRRGPLWYLGYHTGADWAAPSGTPIVAAAPGHVASIGYSSAYGNYVVVKHLNAQQAWYCHLSVVQVSRGQRVGAGTRIGLVGATGNVTGPHLHLEIRVPPYTFRHGGFLDPAPLTSSPPPKLTPPPKPVFLGRLTPGQRSDVHRWKRESVILNRDTTKAIK